MSYRSMFSRGVVVAVLAAAAFAVPASAAGVVVAGPTPSGATVRGEMHGSRLCLDLAVPPSVSAGESGSDFPRDAGGCGPVAPLAPLGIGSTEAASRYPAVVVIGGYVGAAVATVELKRAGRVVGRAETQPSPLSGSAGAVRFYAVEAPAASEPDELAFLDAAGTVRRAMDADADPSLPQALTTVAPSSGGKVLARGRRGGVPWTLRSSFQRPIVSTPLDPERRVTLPCVELRWGPGANGTDGTETCDAPGRETAHVLTMTADGCGSIGRAVGALARRDVARVVVVLGDGTRRALPLHAIPGGDGIKAGAVVLGGGVAVRRLVAYSAAGRVLETQPLRRQPLAPERCEKGLVVIGGVAVIEYGSSLLTRPVGDPPHRIAALDHGAQLCLGIDRAPAPPAGCAVPPVAESDARLEAAPARGGRYVVGLVTPAIATARLTLDDGSKRLLPATPIPGYSGQYAASVKLVAGDVTGPHHVVRYELLDDQGRVLQRGYEPEAPDLRKVATLGRVPGRPPLILSRAPRVPGVRSFAPACVSFGAPQPDERNCAPTSTGFVTLTADCADRRVVVVGAVAHRTDTLSIRLAGGRERRGRTFPLPSVVDGAAAIGVVVLGRHDAARALVLRGSSPRRAAMVLPPASEQCGYAGFFDLPRASGDD